MTFVSVLSFGAATLLTENLGSDEELGVTIFRATIKLVLR